MASILIVDDESALCNVLSAYLEKRGHAVTIANTVQEALGHLRVRECDVILLDVRMPDASGLEAVPQIRALSRASIVVITGVDDYRIADLFYEHGVAAYVHKPLELGVLSNLIDGLPTPCTTP